MEMIFERLKESMYFWNKIVEKSDFEVVEVFMLMSCSWKFDFKKYVENRFVILVFDLLEEENLFLGIFDFYIILVFCLILFYSFFDFEFF